MDKWERAHRQELALLERKIKAIYEQAIKEAAGIGMTVGDLTEDIFTFDKFPITHERIDKLIKDMGASMERVIVNGVDSAWTLANNKNDEIALRVFGDNIGKLTQAQYRQYFTNNDKAREAFLARKENGLNLSDKVWDYTKLYKRELELGLDVGIRNGLSADEMSRELRSYLQHPDKLFRRVKDEHGNLQLSKAAKAFHPGPGVYRSSYMNARRLAVTENNMAYRTSDYERYQRFDFVVGIEVHLSNNHNCKGVPNGQFVDICDELQGKYPKDFKFVGWHPHCRCYVTSILKTPEEMEADEERMDRGEELTTESENEVTDVPRGFTEWVKDNQERAKGWENMPYFIKQNPNYVENFEVNTYTPQEKKFTRARKTNASMEESLGIYLQREYPDIPNTEIAAIFHYTRGDIPAYRRLNNQLRKGELNEFNQAFSQLLSQGLSKLETTQETVYRTIRLNRTGLKEFVENAIEQKEVVFNGFTSASFSKEIAIELSKKNGNIKKNETDVLLVIKSKKGHPIEKISQFGGRFEGKPNQREVMFDKGSTFLFRKIIDNGNIKVFYIDEV